MAVWWAQLQLANSLRFFDPFDRVCCLGFVDTMPELLLPQALSVSFVSLDPERADTPRILRISLSSLLPSGL
jgi:hypothetical protein